MRISNCKGCGRIFNVLSDEQYCPNCQKKMDEKFDIVKRFVEDNPNVIRTGRFCDECKTKLTNTLRSALDTPKGQDKQLWQQDDKNRMRYIR